MTFKVLSESHGEHTKTGARRTLRHLLSAGASSRGRRAFPRTRPRSKRGSANSRGCCANCSAWRVRRVVINVRGGKVRSTRVRIPRREAGKKILGDLLTATERSSGRYLGLRSALPDEKVDHIQKKKGAVT